MIAVRVRTPEEAFQHALDELVRLIKLRLCGGNLPDLQVELNGAADRVAEAVRKQVAESETYYVPILKGLEPDLKDRFQELSWEHEALAGLAEQMRREVHEGRPMEALDTLQRMSHTLRDHTHHQDETVRSFLHRDEKTTP